MTALSIQLAIDSRLENVPLIGAALRGLCRTGAFSPEDCQVMELCVTEAVVNSIAHAYGHAPEHEVHVTVCDDGGRFKITVRDTGTPMPAGMLERKRAEAHDFDPVDIARIPTSGRGLAIIQSFMDTVDYCAADDGNHLVMIKRKHRLKE
jgi:serine/threonine-protein kinase RsbW